MTDSRPKRFASGERTLARQQIPKSEKGEDVVPNAIVDPIPFDEKPLFAYCYMIGQRAGREANGDSCNFSESSPHSTRSVGCHQAPNSNARHSESAPKKVDFLERSPLPTVETDVFDDRIPIFSSLKSNRRKSFIP